jgi:acyl-CoA reductase-like NAD-dependent aldehyde dehydrogenase
MLQDNIKRAASIAFPTQAVIDGKLAAAKSGKTFDNVGPRDGKIVSKVAACEAEDIDAAVKAARAAFEDGRWRGKHPREKKKIMFKLAELMERDLEELAFLRDAGYGQAHSRHAERRYSDRDQFDPLVRGSAGQSLR